MEYAVASLSCRNQQPFRAVIPGSKSFTNRALIIAAQRMGETVIRGGLHCDDTDHLAACLNAFGGLSVQKTADGYVVRRSARRLTAPEHSLYIAGAGTPARFLLGFAAMAEGSTIVRGNARLNERPMGDLLEAFDAMGVLYECLSAPGVLPIRIQGGLATNCDWTVRGDTSSQFTSSLLLLAAQQREGGAGEVTVRVRGRLVSRPYVNMTIQMIREVGIAVRVADADTFVVTPGEPKRGVIQVEPDASGMSYFLGAAAVTGTSVLIPGISADSAQGDVGFAGLLERMGCTLAWSREGLLLSSSGKLCGIDCDMDTMPDTVLTLAAVAALAEGSTRIANVGNLRVKECDRLRAAATELQRLGVSVEEGPDYLVIHPSGRINPADIETYDDHRVAMAFSLVGLCRNGVVIKEPACVAKSFPAYWREFARFQDHHAAKAA